MLALKRHAFLALYFIVPTALVVGCVVKDDVDTETPINSSSNNSSSITTGTGGSGGTGTGGSGGASSCVDDVADTVIDAARCDELAISPAQGATQCINEPDQEGPGYRICNWQFQYFNEGAIEFVYNCLDQIGVQNACDVEPADACIASLYDSLCANDNITQRCTAMGTDCSANGDETFDVDLCSLQLAPFSDAGVDLLITCINGADPNLNCLQAYETCRDTALVY
jgi:hypothetical protein